jgi:hypothetical protein
MISSSLSMLSAYCLGMSISDVFCWLTSHDLPGWLCKVCLAGFARSAWLALQGLPGWLCKVCLAGFARSAWLALQGLPGWLCKVCLAGFGTPCKQA